MSATTRRVVVTGMGMISPLGNSPAALWDAISAGRSGVRHLQSLPTGFIPTNLGGEAAEFNGSIEQFGTLEKTLQRSIKKGLKLMCREIQMGVAAAQLAIQDAGWAADTYRPEQVGTMYGSDYIISEPGEFAAGIHKCTTNGTFEFSRWGKEGLPQVEPLWLLKYLPNMPASHVAIYNDFRGPSNSVTLREASSNLSIAESVTTIRRGIADAIVVGSTGTRIHPLRTVHVALQERLAPASDSPEKACRPFDANHAGMVMGEGAGVLVLEELEAAQKRGARILAEVTGYGSSTVCSPEGVVNYQQVFENVIEMALERAGLKPTDLGHVHAHGLSDPEVDIAEANAIRKTLGDVPVTALKSYMGNLGAGSGMVEAIASILSLNEQTLFPILNYDSPASTCPINGVREIKKHDGNSFLNLNVSPQGQASAVVMQRLSA
ncbi:MAG: beta-ketoacyl-[acyl-carrier-protein] synthase family protein [Pirellulaceae bacterium]